MKDDQAQLALEALPGKIGESISKFKLESFIWEQVNRHYDYHSEHPTLLDFLLQLIRFSIATLLENPPKLSNEAGTLINHWKDSYEHRVNYDQLSKIIAAENFLSLFSQMSPECILQ